MFQVLATCSSCSAEDELLVEQLDDVEREVCACGYSYVVLTVSEFEPVHAVEGAQVVELPHRRKLRLVA